MSPPITTTATFECGFRPPNLSDPPWDPPFSGPPGGINVPAIRGIGTTWASRDSFAATHYTFQIFQFLNERAASVMTIGVMRNGSNVRVLRGYLSYPFTFPTPPEGRDIRIDDAYFTFNLALTLADPVVNEEDAFIESAHSRVSVGDRKLIVLLLDAPLAGHTENAYAATTLWATSINRSAVPAASIKITDATAAPPYTDAPFVVPIDPAMYPVLGKTPDQAGTYFLVLHENDFDGTEPGDSTNEVREVISFYQSAQMTVTYTEFTPEPPPGPPPPGPDTMGPINRTIYCDWTGAAPTDQNRNWCPEWTTPASSMCLSRRSDGSLAILFGTNDGTGRILRLDASTHNDDGEAIDAMYQTAYVGGSSGRNTFQYLTSSVAGDGPLDMGAVYPDGILVKPLKTRELQAFPTKDQEWSGLRILTERIAWRFGTNAVDAWFKLRKLCGYARPSPWSRTLGPPSN